MVSRPLDVLLILLVSGIGRVCAADASGEAPVFSRHVVAVFSRLGCNAGTCHGAVQGKNGFRLSLFGAQPHKDYEAVVREFGGRRLDKQHVERSLLLLKATGVMAHAGGKRMELGSDEYKLVLRWIASGLPTGKAEDPTVTKITVYPDHSIMTRNNKQQFAVYAHYSDGSVQDVTQRAQYESNAQEIAIVDGAALVRSLDLSGEAAVMARYQAQVAVFRATVPSGQKVPDYQWTPKTVVDNYTQKKWKELEIVPAELSSDVEFVRRVYLDLLGTLPSPAEVQAFKSSMDPNKRDKLIDELLERPEADVNVEFQSNSKFADASQKLAWALADANDKYATDYPAHVGQHMTNTDSQPFQDIAPAISVRENCSPSISCNGLQFLNFLSASNWCVGREWPFL